MDNQEPRDLVVLVADSHQKAAVTGILSRAKAMGIRSVEADIRVHILRDPGCLREAHEFLRSFSRKYLHALVLFDREGCGQDDRPREVLEDQVQQHLSRSGWEDRSAVVVIEPELEAWVWSESPEVDAALGWEGRSPKLRDWLAQGGFLPAGQVKPLRPKEAMVAALRQAGRP
jgi:hypothetical protein